MFTAPTASRRILTFAALGALVLFAITFGCLAGSADLSARQVWDALIGQGDELTRSIVWQLRLPRVLAGLAVGALLSLAGVLLQTLLRNPLADPYVLGLSGGGAIGALAAMSLGAGLLATQGSAALGALAALLLVMTLGERGSNARLLLTGAVVTAGAIGFVGLIVPHAARLALRTADHRWVAPAAALAGGALLVTADALARTVAAPRQLPVGAVMALLGAPIFVLLLRRAAR